MKNFNVVKVESFHVQVSKMLDKGVFWMTRLCDTLFVFFYNWVIINWYWYWLE